jgi:hypothetical protein
MLSCLLVLPADTNSSKEKEKMHNRESFPILLFLLLILAFSFSGCGSDNASNTPEAQKITAVYSVAGGNATYSYEVAVDEDGSIRKTITDVFTIETTVKSGYLNETEKNQFYALVLDAKVFELNDTYIFCTVNCPTDTPWQALTITIAGNEKTISFDLTPTDKILILTQKIDELANKL